MWSSRWLRPQAHSVMPAQRAGPSAKREAIFLPLDSKIAQCSGQMFFEPDISANKGYELWMGQGCNGVWGWGGQVALARSQKASPPYGCNWMNAYQLWHQWSGLNVYFLNTKGMNFEWGQRWKGDRGAKGVGEQVTLARRQVALDNSQKTSPPPPIEPIMKWHFIKGFMESCKNELRSTPLWKFYASTTAPSLWKVWLHKFSHARPV